MDCWQALTVLGDGFARTATVPVPEATTGVMLTMWRGYYQHRDDVLVFENTKAQLVIAQWYEDLKRLGETIRAYERQVERFDEMRMSSPPRAIGEFPRITMGPSARKREHFIEEMRKQSERTKELMAELGIRNALGQGNNPL